MSEADSQKSSLLDTDHTLVSVVVENLSKNVTKAHLLELFGELGHIRAAEMPVGRLCTNRCVCYISFEEERSAHEAVKIYDQAWLDGSCVRVSLVELD